MSKTYSSSHYSEIDRVEKSHFWFMCRSQLLRKVFLRYIPKAKGVRFLEIGCGTGVLLDLLSRLGFSTTGLDVNEKALTYARRKVTLPLIRKSIYSYVSHAPFDAVGVFDVMEHQSDDALFLVHCRDLLKERGYIFLTVPAGQWLWSRVDDASGHKRRYSAFCLQTLVEEAGFEVVMCKYWNCLLLPLYYIQHKFFVPQQSGDLVMHSLFLPHPILNLIFRTILSIENRLLFLLSFPFGASLVLVGRKSDT